MEMLKFAKKYEIIVFSFKGNYDVIFLFDV